MGLSVKPAVVARGGTSTRVVPSSTPPVRILSSPRMVPPTIPSGKSLLSLLMSPMRQDVRIKIPLFYFFFSNNFYFYHDKETVKTLTLKIFFFML